ncbi:hypothetical protein [Jatrophihabitans fulvus]
MSQRQSVLSRIAESLANIGPALSGVVPALRSKRGLFGTARAESRQLDDQRRSDYPSDRRR